MFIDFYRVSELLICYALILCSACRDLSLFFSHVASLSRPICNFHSDATVLAAPGYLKCDTDTFILSNDYIFAT